MVQRTMTKKAMMVYKMLRRDIHPLSVESQEGCWRCAMREWGGGLRGRGGCGSRQLGWKKALVFGLGFVPSFLN